MGIELSPELLLVLKETEPFKDPAVFEQVRVAAKPEIDKLVREVMGPKLPIADTLTEVRDLYLNVHQHAAQLAKVNYGPERRVAFCNGIRLLATSDLWFSEGRRTGAFKGRTVEEIIDASRPWRARLATFAGQAFFAEPEIEELFLDVNSSGTIDEEKSDLNSLLTHVNKYKDRLTAVAMPEAFILEGQALLDEANGRDLLGVLGIRTQDEAITLRNRILTYTTLLGREARAAGINACYHDAEARARFEAASFRDALRRLKPKRRGAKGDEEAEPEPAQPAAPVAQPNAKPVADPQPA